jgi:signal transduction histidine kinase
MLAPLREARTALAEVRAGRRDGLSGALPRELDGLAREFDALLDGQRRAARIVRERAADLAHGLKTPLAVIQAKARDFDDMGRSDIGAELRDIAASMDQRLSRDLARAHIRGALAQPGGAGLAQIVARIARALARARPEPAIDWSIDIPADLTVAMDDGDLTELIGALFDNAAKWATGMVGICALPGAPAVTLLIDDDGPGLAPQHRRAALSRGALLDPERSGTGLGLAIAADVVAAYGGEIVLEDSPLGGLRVRLTLPAAGAGISSRG